MVTTGAIKRAKLKIVTTHKPTHSVIAKNTQKNCGKTATH